MKTVFHTPRKLQARAYTVGRKAFARVSAVEDLRLTAAMEADFREFDRKGLSARERRAALARKCGAAR
jgi:hypothetical protein